MRRQSHILHTIWPSEHHTAIGWQAFNNLIVYLHQAICLISCQTSGRLFLYERFVSTLQCNYWFAFKTTWNTLTTKRINICLQIQIWLNTKFSCALLYLKNIERNGLVVIIDFVGTIDILIAPKCSVYRQLYRKHLSKVFVVARGRCLVCVNLQ